MMDYKRGVLYCPYIALFVESGRHMIASRASDTLATRLLQPANGPSQPFQPLRPSYPSHINRHLSWPPVTQLHPSCHPSPVTHHPSLSPVTPFSGRVQASSFKIDGLDYFNGGSTHGVEVLPYPPVRSDAGPPTTQGTTGHVLNDL